MLCLSNNLSRKEQISNYIKKINKSSLLFNVITQIKQEIIRKESLHEEFFEILWHCAQNMNYPDFYRALHSSSSSNAELSTDD